MASLIPLVCLLPILLLFAYLFSDQLIQRILIFAVVGIILYYLHAYRYFRLKDPDRLQSEKYQIAIAHIDTLTAKDSLAPINFNHLGQQSFNPLKKGESNT